MDKSRVNRYVLYIGGTPVAIESKEHADSIIEQLRSMKFD